MRVHVELDDDLAAQVDRIAGPRGRSAFVRAAVERAGRREIRWSAIEAPAGAIDDEGHDWDGDPADWVREQRRADPAGRGDARWRCASSTWTHGAAAPGKPKDFRMDEVAVGHWPVRG